MTFKQAMKDAKRVVNQCRRCCDKDVQYTTLNGNGVNAFEALEAMEGLMMIFEAVEDKPCTKK